MIVKVHETNDKKIIVIVDSGLIGKKTEEKNLQLDLTAEFYQGEEKTVKENEEMMHSASFLHFVGKESVDFGIKKGLVDKRNVVMIGKVPHAEVILIAD